EGRPEDGDVELLQSIEPVTQALALDRSTRRPGLRIPPQQHPVAALVRERGRLTVLIGHREVGGGGAGTQHAGQPCTCASLGKMRPPLDQRATTEELEHVATLIPPEWTTTPVS